MKVLAVCALVCAMMALTAATSEPIGVQSCPSGWSSYNGRIFLYVSTEMTWTQAEQHCQSVGANLVSVHSAEEYRKIQNLIETVSYLPRAAWIGGSDTAQEGVWVWSDGSPFDYHHCGHFDNRGGRQHCLQMNYGVKRCWDDVECSSKRPSVCAKKI